MNLHSHGGRITSLQGIRFGNADDLHYLILDSINITIPLLTAFNVLSEETSF